MSRGRWMLWIALPLLGGTRAAAELAPTGIDAGYPPQVGEPRLSWVVESRRWGERQTGYQVLVAQSETTLEAGRGDLWDSGKVASHETAHVPYGGRALTSGQECWWKVRCWDRDGQPSPYSAPARWTMGLLHPSDWKAQWISLESDPGTQAPASQPEPAIHNLQSEIPNSLVLPPCPFLRKAFYTERPVRRAYLTATALGLYEMRLNGHRVGDELFRPGWTDYRKRLYYQTYDVTGLLRPGQNALAAILGDGWACGYVGLGGRNRYGIRIRVPSQAASRRRLSLVYELCSSH